MHDRNRILVSLLAADDEPVAGEVTVLDVMAMLYALGDEYRRAARPEPALAPV